MRAESGNVNEVNGDDSPKAQEVRDHLARLYNFERFRGPKLRTLLGILIDEWLANRGVHLSEAYIGQKVGETAVLEQESNKLGYPKTRGNLGHVRKRLKEYCETVGYRDPIIIKMNAGSYIPEVAYNPHVTGIPDLDPESARLILRAKMAIDARTFRGATRAFEYYSQLLDLPLTNARQASNLIFIPSALAPIFPNTTKTFREIIEALLVKVRATGVEPWECTFANACRLACFEHDWKQSLRSFEISIVNSQKEATYFWWYTALLASQMRIEEAVDILDSAVRHFSRTNIATRTDLALLQTMARRYDDAEELLSASLDLTRRDNPLIAYHFALLYEAQDRLTDAHNAVMHWCRRAAEFDSEHLSAEDALTVDWHSFLVGMLALVQGRGGQHGDANAFVEQLLRRKAKFDRTSSVEIAIGLLGLGRNDDAVMWLHKAAFEEGDPFSMWFHILPPLRHLRGHRGFRDLLKKLHLPMST